jgi:hypothetical protein
MTDHSTADETQSQSPASKPRSRRRRRFLIALVIAAVLLALLLTAGWASLPWTSDMLAEWALGDLWKGQIDIGEVSLSLSGPIVLHHVTFRDHHQRQWVYAERLDLHFAHWPSHHPVLQRIVASKVLVTAYLDQGRLDPPLLWPDPKTPSEPSSYLDLQEIALPDMQLSVMHADTAPSDVSIPPYSPLAVLDELRLTGKASGNGSLRFVFDPDVRIETDAEIQLNFHTVDVRNLRSLLAMGPLEAGAPAPLHLTNLKTKPMTYRNGQLRLPAVQARCEGGLLWGGLRMQLEPGKPKRYTAYLRCRELPLRTIAASIDPNKNIAFGQVLAIVNDIQGEDLGWNHFNASATVMLDEADVQKERVAGELLRTARHESTPQPDSRSDLRVILRITDGIVNIQSGKMGNELAAIFVEPGGTIDLASGVLHFYVLTASLSDLQKIPLLKIFANLASNITRLHVVGTWDDPKITKAPARDFAHSAKEFFSDIIKTGGELPMLLIPDSD